MDKLKYIFVRTIYFQHLLEKGGEKIEHKLSEIKKHHDSGHFKQKPTRHLGGVSVPVIIYLHQLRDQFLVTRHWKDNILQSLKQKQS